MMSIEDYILLLESLDDVQDDEDCWMPSDPFTKTGMKLSNSIKSIDAINFTKNEIQEALYTGYNIKIGSFLIKIDEFHGKPNTNLTMDIEIVKMTYKTMSGFPCNMENKIYLQNDNRFVGKPWLNYFNSNGIGYDIPIDIVVDIVKWLQAVQKMSAFL